MFHRTCKLFSPKPLKTYTNQCCWISHTRQLVSIPHSNIKRIHPSCISSSHSNLLRPYTPLISTLKCFGLSRHHGAKKRSNEEIAARRDMFARHDKEFRSCSKLSVEEWESMSAVGDEAGLTKQVCDALILKKCISAGNYNLGSSYMDFMEQHQKREPTAGCLALYMDLCTLGYQECGELPILSAYDRLSARLPAFPSKLAERAAVALSCTSRWRNGLAHLEDIHRRGEIPSTHLLAALSRAAFENSDGTTGWKMLEDVFKKRYNNLAELLQAFNHYCSAMSEEESDAEVQRLLRLAGMWQVYPDAASVQQLVEGLDIRGWAVRNTSIGHGGQCQHCGERLKHEPIAEDSFRGLREEILERVLKREDIFQVTSPEEFEQFNEVVESKGPFTHILDGLNIGFVRGSSSRQRGPGTGRSDFRHAEHNKSMAGNLLKIIDDIMRENPKSKVLVIGRNHMRRWHRATMMNVHIKATVFYLQNVTLDDSYFLYAALHSGPDTKIVTNDLLRNHQFRLGTDDDQQRTFRLWKQRVQQNIAIPTVSLQPLSPFTVAAQQSESGQRWHVPYDDGSLEFSYLLPHTWLCLAAKGLATEDASSATGRPETKKYTERSAGVMQANRNPRTVTEDRVDSNFSKKSGRNDDQITNSKNKYVKRKKLNVDISKFF